MRIAFLGLGRMGRELATHLVNDGHDVTVWNRTSAATVTLTELGANVALDPADAVVGVEIVITALFGPDAVRDVVIDSELPISAGSTWLDITTIGPADAAAFQAWAADRAVGYVHGPVIGSLAPARARKLSVLLGGNAGDLAKIRDVLIWADPAKVRTYDSPAKAATAKLIANLTVAVATQGIIEALRLGHSNDLATDEVLAMLELTMLAGISALKADTILARSFEDTQFSADLLTKDSRLMFHSSDYPLPALAAAFDSLQSAVRAGHGNDDFSVITAGDAT